MRIPVELEGPVVVDVKARTPAARAGLQVGDVIRQVNQRSVEDIKGLRAAVESVLRDEPDRPVVLLVQRGQVSLYLAVDPSGR